MLNLLLAFAVVLMVTPSVRSHAEDVRPKPKIRNFLVTECTKKTGCLMKMRPHEKVTAKDGSITWRKIQ